MTPPTWPPPSTNGFTLPWQLRQRGSRKTVARWWKASIASCSCFSDNAQMVLSGFDCWNGAIISLPGSTAGVWDCVGAVETRTMKDVTASDARPIANDDRRNVRFTARDPRDDRWASPSIFLRPNQGRDFIARIPGTYVPSILPRMGRVNTMGVPLSPDQANRDCPDACEAGDR